MSFSSILFCPGKSRDPGIQLPKIPESRDSDQGREIETLVLSPLSFKHFNFNLTYLRLYCLLLIGLGIQSHLFHYALINQLVLCLYSSSAFQRPLKASKFSFWIICFYISPVYMIICSNTMQNGDFETTSNSPNRLSIMNVTLQNVCSLQFLRYLCQCRNAHVLPIYFLVFYVVFSGL